MSVSKTVTDTVGCAVQIFSEAAKDKEATIVRLAFDTIEKIVREHFTCITETDVVVFTDCVNCLTAYTNQDHSEDVALNAIAFLRFCAIRLAEGSIGDVDTLPEEEVCPRLGAPNLAIRWVRHANVLYDFVLTPVCSFVRFVWLRGSLATRTRFLRRRCAFCVCCLCAFGCRIPRASLFDT